MSDKLAERMLEFTYQKPSEATQAKMVLVRKSFQNMCEILDSILPECRNKSLAFTALEDSSTRAMRALSHSDLEATQESP